MLKEYELTIICKPDLPETDKQGVFAKYEHFMTSDGGQILKKDDWGIKKMAFPMKKSHRGHYLNYDFIGTAANLAEIERLLRIDDNILRHMSVFLAKNVDAAKRKEELVAISQAMRDSLRQANGLGEEGRDIL